MQRPQVPRVVRREEAIASGWTPDAIQHAVDRGAWTRLYRGVYLTAPGTPTEHDRWWAATTYAGHGALLSGAAALRALSFDRVPRPDRILVLVTRTSSVASTSDLLLRRTAITGPVLAFKDIPIAPVARAVLDYAMTLRRIDDIDGVLSQALRRRLSTSEDLVAAVPFVARRGSKLVRESVSTIGRSWSPAESALGRALRRIEVHGWKQNVDVHSPTGAFLGTADFWFEQHRAALEVHGAKNHSELVDWAETVRRTGKFAAAGVPMLQVPAIDVFRTPDAVAAQVKAWLATLPLRKKTR